MNKKETIIYYKISIVSIVTQALLLFFSLLPAFVVAIISLILFVFCFYNFRKCYNLVECLLLNSILFIPTSTISILGTSYSQFPLTWHNFLIIVLFIYILIEGKANLFYLMTMFIMFVFGLITSLSMPYIIEALKQLLMIVLFISSFIIGKRFGYYSKDLSDVGWKIYFIGVVTFAIQVYLQQAFILSTGSIIGHYAAMGGGRLAYAGLMGDYSFASLFLTSGCMYGFLQFVQLKRWRFVTFIFFELFFLLATIVVSARTGIFSFFIALALFYVFNLRRVSIAKFIVLLMGIIGIPIVFVSIMANRVGQSFLDSSGRIESYIIGLKVFLDKLFLGYGFGLDNLEKITGLGAPHNIIIQFLVQTGLIGTIIFFSNFIKFAFEELRKAGCYKWIFIMVMIGSMLIPDIFSSRYLYAIVVLCMISANQINIKVVRKENETKSGEVSR